MAAVLSPFVYWGQNTNFLSLNVSLRDLGSAPEVILDEDHLEVKAEGTGCQGFHNYEFQIEFYLPVDPKKSKFRVKETGIEFNIKKQVRDCWPRLTYDNKKPAWLKIDFDHFEYDSSEKEIETDPEEEKERREMLDKMEQEVKKSKRSVINDIRKGYLFLYNLFQWVGYSFVFTSLMIRYHKHGPDSRPEAFEKVGAQLMLCQFLALMEIMHPLLGFVKSKVLTTAVQVLGRNLVLFVLILNNPDIQKHYAVWWLFSAWSLVEIFRYPFYMLSSIGQEWGLVSWLRYTVWIPLYPMGFMCEGYIILQSLPYFEDTNKFSLILPNRFNMAFNFPLFLKIYMVAMLPGFYLLMMHMYKLRKNKLTPNLRKKAAMFRKGPSFFRAKIQ
ncbi:very-long-chain (3R)-3-hydroxyacyl-CoA dehydratase-like [Tubulanus polymorphus]|uniref:very-long-chain (3R)-3-hydroxyacyl-CoA dehydratase-like n=1 Tax=Tubulanus polymorphus TaxID=672921 RepID=UPI003DA2A48A